MATALVVFRDADLEAGKVEFEYGADERCHLPAFRGADGSRPTMKSSAVFARAGIEKCQDVTPGVDTSLGVSVGPAAQGVLRTVGWLDEDVLRRRTMSSDYREHRFRVPHPGSLRGGRGMREQRWLDGSPRR